MDSDDVIITHIRFICSSCKHEMMNPKKGCQFCGSREYVSFIDQDKKEEREVSEIIKRLKEELDKK